MGGVHVIEGRANIDCLFHDSDGSNRLNVLSLRSYNRYSSGEVVIVTGTAGTAQTVIAYNTYRNAAGNLVDLSDPALLAFSWSGDSQRTLTDGGDDGWKVLSSGGQVAVTQLPSTEPVPYLSGGVGTGTYTIILWGTD